jgi:hypothetical protein
MLRRRALCRLPVILSPSPYPKGISSRRRTILVSPAARTKCEPSLRLAGQDAGHHGICPPNLGDAALKANRERQERRRPSDEGGACFVT